MIPIDLETIVLKAIAKEPSERYTTAKEFSDDLLRFIENRPPMAHRPTLAAQFVKWSGRHIRSLIALTILLSVFSISAFVAAILVWREQGRTEIARLKTVDALRIADDQRADANLQRQNAQRLSVTLALDRGLGLCEQGELAHGLLWLARALELTTDDQPDLQSVIRCNLHDWSEHLIPMTGMMRWISKAFQGHPKYRRRPSWEISSFGCTE